MPHRKHLITVITRAHMTVWRLGLWECVRCEAPWEAFCRMRDLRLQMCGMRTALCPAVMLWGFEIQRVCVISYVAFCRAGRIVYHFVWIDPDLNTSKYTLLNRLTSPSRQMICYRTPAQTSVPLEVKYSRDGIWLSCIGGTFSSSSQSTRFSGLQFLVLRDFCVQTIAFTLCSHGIKWSQKWLSSLIAVIRTCRGCICHIRSVSLAWVCSAEPILVVGDAIKTFEHLTWHITHTSISLLSWRASHRCFIEQCEVLVFLLDFDTCCFRTVHITLHAGFRGEFPAEMSRSYSVAAKTHTSDVFVFHPLDHLSRIRQMEPLWTCLVMSVVQTQPFCILLISGS